MTRRRFLRTASTWGGIILSLVPFFFFVSKRRIRPPTEVRIRKKLRPGEFLVEPDFVLFATDGALTAVSRRCTHLGCTIQYLEAEKGFLCPCHQSRFTWDGKYVSGPAKKDLARYDVRESEEGDGYLVLVPRGGA